MLPRAAGACFKHLVVVVVVVFLVVVVVLFVINRKCDKTVLSRCFEDCAFRRLNVPQIACGTAQVAFWSISGNLVFLGLCSPCAIFRHSGAIR